MTNFEWLAKDNSDLIMKMLTGHWIDCPMKNEKCGSPYQKSCGGKISAEDVIECQRAFGNWLTEERKTK